MHAKGRDLDTARGELKGKVPVRVDVGECDRSSVLKAFRGDSNKKSWRNSMNGTDPPKNH